MGELHTPRYVPFGAPQPSYWPAAAAGIKRLGSIGAAAPAAVQQKAPRHLQGIGSATVMIKNIACRYTQEEAKEILDALGFRGQFDWIYMPRSPNMQSNLGYVFINFRSKEDMERCKRVCHGKPFGSNSSLKLAEVVPAHIQGDVQTFARMGRNGKNKARAEPLFVNDPPETEGQRQERKLSDFWSEASSAAAASDEGAAPAPQRGRSAALYDVCSLIDCPSDDPAPRVRTVSSHTSLFEGVGVDFAFFEGGPSGDLSGAWDWAPADLAPEATAEVLPAPRTSSPGSSGLEPFLAPPGLCSPPRASPASKADGEDEGSVGRGLAGGTTVMLKNIACQYTVESIKRTLDELGLGGSYDDVYIPRSQARQGNLGYAFVNFLDAVAVEECRRLCHGHPFGHSQSQKVCEVVLAHIQAPGSEHTKARKPKRKPQPANLSEMLGSYGFPEAHPPDRRRPVQSTPFDLGGCALQGDSAALIGGAHVLLKLSV